MILITGATGFIGNHFLMKFIDTGYKIKGLFIIIPNLN
ncbi:MAG: NAD-dependent epimerase/dehydratase family protein [Alphaproteobacteria bacterium]|nr:NAD-dependent epimerase/dehydratase family protein [Alphaproteobacteria bacterium]